jgi:hypothetical protein
MASIIVGYIVLGIIGFIILGTFIIVLLKLLTLFKKLMKRRAPKEVRDIDAKDVIKQMDPDVYEVMSNHMKIVNNHNQSVKYVTETFIREVYVATFHKPETGKSIDEMIESLAEESIYRYRFLTYKFDEFNIYDHKNVLVGVNRTTHSGPTRVKYMLTKTINGWRINHIVRLFQGEIIDKNIFEDGNTGYVLQCNDEDSDAIYCINSVAKPKYKSLDIGQKAYVEGYLEVNYLIDGGYFYHVVNLNAIH